MLSIEEIIAEKPRNASYRKTIFQSHPSGTESRWDIFYDEHDNEIRNICTSDAINHPMTNSVELKDSPFLTDIIYDYNDDDTIAATTTVFLGEVKVNRFVYNGDKKIIRVFQSENGISGSSLSYEYDEHDNPIKIQRYIGGDIVGTDEYEYLYDEIGRISYMVWKNRLFEEQIFKIWYEYDEHGNITITKKFREGGDVPTYEKYYYDENDCLIRSESYMDDQLLAESIFEYEFYS